MVSLFDVVVDPWRELQGRDLEDLIECVFAYKTYVVDSCKYIYRRNENYVKVKST